MTATNAPGAVNGQREPLKIEMAKVIEGVSLVFSGAVTMLEALHPHVSLEPSAILNLVTGNIEGLEQMAAEKRAAEKQEEADNGTKGTSDGAVGIAVDDVAAPVGSDKAAAVDQAATSETTASVTLDDITKIIVQKIKQNRSNNEKIGQILNTYGVAKVSELPPAKYEAFVTDLSAI